MIGKVIKRLREAYKLTQTQLGDAIGISKGLLSKYETNRSITPDDIKIKIAEYFNVSTDYLLGVIHEPISYKSRSKIKTVIIPNNFTDDDIKKIDEFIEFLVYKKR